jgi:predicted DsbA family dithiol-disulfide isomerase
VSTHSVTIWSDYICPFCYVGLERGEWLAERFGADVEWLPFDLHPEYPPEGIPRTALEERYGPGIHERTREAIEAADLTYNPPARIPNSRAALAVTELARDRGLHEEVHARLMHAYWSEARDLGERETLLDLVEEAGLDRTEAAAALDDEMYAGRVRESTERAQLHGIAAVPAFVLDGRLLVLGAQPHAVFEEAMTILEAKVEA